METEKWEDAFLLLDQHPEMSDKVRCSVLQCVVVCCSVLQCVDFDVLQRVAECCFVCVALCCFVCVAACCFVCVAACCLVCVAACCFVCVAACLLQRVALFLLNRHPEMSDKVWCGALQCVAVCCMFAACCLLTTGQASGGFEYGVAVCFSVLQFVALGCLFTGASISQFCWNSLVA